MTYCQTKRVNYDKLFVAKSEDQFSSFLSKYKNIPAVFIFDKNKFLITTAVKTDCPWAMINLLDHSVLESKIIRDTLLYSNLLSYFTLVDAKMKNKDSDYYIICTWAKYFPKLTDALFETINKQKEEKKLNVCHILLNVDLQDSWESKK